MTGLIETKDTHNFLVVELHTNFAKKYIYIFMGPTLAERGDDSRQRAGTLKHWKQAVLILINYIAGGGSSSYQLKPS
jgi:hypothetical protein